VKKKKVYPFNSTKNNKFCHTPKKIIIIENQIEKKSGNE